MKREYIIQKASNTRLIIFFTGWSTNPQILSRIKIPEGYDLICCYDYTQIRWKSIEKEYQEGIIIAWSLGVKVAEILYDQLSKTIHVTGVYAINGTGTPVDDLKGIPKEIFQTTLETLNERNLKKFRIRICGSVPKFNELEKNLTTELIIKDLKEELKEIQKLNDISNPSIWDLAFLSEMDLIFPLENMKNYWSDTPYKILRDTPHTVDFQEIFNLIIKNKNKIGENFKKNEEKYQEAAIVQKEIADRLIKICEEGNLLHKKILEIGSGSGILTDKIICCLSPEELYTMDLSERKTKSTEIFVPGDAETEILKFDKEKFDLIISASTFQWFHSPLKILKEIKRILNKKGKLIFTVFIEGTFEEIKNMMGTSLLYLKASDWLNLATKAGFKVVMKKEDENILTFSNFYDLLKHIKTTGVNSLSHQQLRIGEVRKMAFTYPKENGLYKLTYKSLTLILE